MTQWSPAIRRDELESCKESEFLTTHAIQIPTFSAILTGRKDAIVTPRTLFRDFRWSDESIEDWHEVWGLLWSLDVGWTWKRGDHYARRRGDGGTRWTVFTAVENNWIHGDLDGLVPLPSIAVVRELLKWTDNRIYSVEEQSREEKIVKNAVVLLEDWIDKYGAVNGTAPLL